ncbi:EpsG family protein [Halobacteriovorax sp.]|uniref:EpsG family protein n=1 Tax=Halobacteriovorax sp. TaxID=2020862 RepID=UPI003AF24BAE
MYYYYLSSLFFSAFLREKKFANLAWALLLSTIFFFFTRSDVSADWVGYKEIFNNIRHLSLEPFWYILKQTNPLKQFSFEVFIFFQSLLYIAPILFIKYKTKNSFSLEYFLIYSLVLGFIILGHGYLRQSVACSFILLAFYYFKERNFISYFITILVATTFHYSAIIGMVLLCEFVIKRLSDKKLMILSLLMPFLLLVPYFLEIPIKYEDKTSTGLALRSILYLYLSLSICVYSYTQRAKRAAIIITYSLITLIPLSFVLGYTTLIDRILHYLAMPLAFGLSLITYRAKNYRNLIGFGILQFIFLVIWLNFGKHADQWTYSNIFFNFK